MRRIRSACEESFAPFAASALTDLQLPREFAEAQPAMADSPAMPVLLHQLPDGDTTGQQWAELPPVLGATQIALPLRRKRGNAFALGAQGRQNYEVPGHWVLLDQVSQVTPPCDPLDAARQ